MSTETGVGAGSSSRQGKTPPKDTALGVGEHSSTIASQSQPHQASPPHLEEERRRKEGEDSTRSQEETEEDERKPSASSEGTTQQSSQSLEGAPRQVIAVSASKGPAAFFNLARKFLVTDEMCDLSALEGAIVSAVDAAHLLERSQLATIVRVNTSYVTVEPKRRKQASQQDDQEHEEGIADSGTGPASGESQEAMSETGSASAGDKAVSPQHQEEGRASASLPPSRQSGPRGSSSAGGRELRRARIVITVKRTESYKRWLQDNPLQAIIAGDVTETDPEHTSEEHKPT